MGHFWGHAVGRGPRAGALSRDAYTAETVSTRPADPSEEQRGELSVGELLRRARPLPPRAEMVIEDLTEEEGEAFLAAVESRARRARAVRPSS